MLTERERTGTVLEGRYRILDRLGHGGMGTVYVAEHVGLGQRRAIKFIRDELVSRPSELRRFIQEARIVSRLQHRHVISVLDVGEADGTAYYVMELLEGEDLRTRLRREGALPWVDVRTIAGQICDALDAAHRRGIVHRDLKPENCFCLRQTDDSVFIKVLDFGIAKVASDDGAARLTGTGEALGTVGYMAPEQLEGVAHPSVDVHALGVMIYEMLAGRPPHTGSAAQVIGRIARGVAPPPLRQFCPEVTPEVEALVEQAMHPDPLQRIRDMLAFAQMLAAIPGEAMGGSRSARMVLEFSAPTLPRVDVHASTVAARDEIVAHAETRPVSTKPGDDAEPAAGLTSSSSAGEDAGQAQLGADIRAVLVVILISAALLVATLIWGRGSASPP